MSLQLRRTGILDTSDAEGELGLQFPGDLLEDNRSPSFYCSLFPFSSVTTAPRLLPSMQDNSLKK